MKINLNNRLHEFDADELSIAEIMQRLSFHFKLLVVKLNGVLIDKPIFASTLVRDGDELMIIHLVSGG
ncbi:MAG: sulfur carrier protein ThiS [Prevotellaceae bacterium]|nr:sulfur carrier protein ThiS [Prevotellaceae bacterium]